MKPTKSVNKDRKRELFRVALSRLIDSAHGPEKMAGFVDWNQQPDQSPDLLPDTTTRIHRQKPKDKNKVYSVHAWVHIDI
jgi:hypothetical protein